MELDQIVTLSELLETVAETQEALQKSESLNRAILGSLKAQLAVLNRDGYIIAANEAWYNFAEDNGDPPLHSIGIGANYLEVGRKAAQMGDQQSLEMTVGIEAVMSGQLPSFLYEYACTSPKEKRWFLMHVTPLKNQEGGVVIAHENVTVLKQIEEALRRSEASMQTVFNASSVAFTLIDHDYTVRAFNSLAVKRSQGIFGRKIRVGDSILDFVRPEDLTGFQTRFPRALNGEYATIEKEMIVNGESIFFEFRYNPVMDEYGNILGVCMTSENITERRLGEQALRESLEKERELSELKSRFVAMASHEFRTPLTGIMSSAELVKNYRDKMNSEKIDEHLAKIIRQVRYMDTLIDDILILGKVQAGKLEFQPEVININVLCRQIVKELQANHPDSKRLLYVCQSQCHDRMLDPKLIRLIVNNLLTNALKYSPNRGEVLFEVTCSDHDITLTIKDSGIGIPEKDRARLFEPFHRASNIGNISGTGLGLAITKQAVELHKGTIVMDSQVGVGTKFFVTLP
jgi:PAS domain S-box-containing protein